MILWHFFPIQSNHLKTCGIYTYKQQQQKAPKQTKLSTLASNSISSSQGKVCLKLNGLW